MLINQCAILGCPVPETAVIVYGPDRGPAQMFGMQCLDARFRRILVEFLAVLIMVNVRCLPSRHLDIPWT